jgi:hypothetical protein
MQRLRFSGFFAGAHPEIFPGEGGGADPEGIYNLCFILKTVL